MYLRILKKDLRRKRTMNVILLMFIILAATFVSSSVNNIVTVTNALDYYFEKAGMPDYFAATMKKAGEASVSEKLEDIPEVESYGKEDILYLTAENFFYKGEKLEGMRNTSILMPFDDAWLNYFDEDNAVIEMVEEGSVYIAGKVFAQSNIAVGDTIEIRIEDVSVELEVAGACKDAMLGSNMMGMSRFILNEADYNKFKENETISAMYGGSLYYINTNAPEKIERVLGNEDSVIFNDDISMIKMSYIMDMIIAGVLLVVSVCLILVAFVVLRFTIILTLTEEYREIGVMKAIGIGTAQIRGLYMVKYLMLAVIGAAFGFLVSIPFGNMLIQSVSESMVMGNDSSILINALCASGVVAIILLFCFGCTGRVKKFSPIDAIRNGTTGERFRKKSMLCLKNTPSKPAFFLAANDVLSSPKRFVTVILIYTLCLSIVLILVNTVNTLKSGDLAYSFGITETDVYYVDEDEIMRYLAADGRELVENRIQEIQNALAQRGIPVQCIFEVIFKLNLVHGENSFKSQTLQGIGTTTDMYRYFEGTPPQNVNEIAITPVTARKLGAEIGDTVTIQHSSGDKEYIITALFQSMNSMGEGVRLHESAETDFLQANGFLAFQIDFEDNPNEAEIRVRIEKIKDILETDNVWTAGEFVERTVGITSMLNQVKRLVLGVVLVIIMLVTVLMERSFITKEQGEIAILKAIGFRTGTIVNWHTLRFGIVSIISTIIALLLAVPLTNFSVGPVFEMMGANYGVEYEIIPLEVYVIYPLIVLAITLISAFLTALYTRTIMASEASGIE